VHSAIGLNGRKGRLNFDLTRISPRNVEHAVLRRDRPIHQLLKSLLHFKPIVLVRNIHRIAQFQQFLLRPIDDFTEFPVHEGEVASLNKTHAVARICRQKGKFLLSESKSGFDVLQIRGCILDIGQFAHRGDPSNYSLRARRCRWAYRIVPSKSCNSSPITFLLLS
jgi:hypothetical protein